MPAAIRIELTPKEQDLLKKPVSGKGGMQALLRSLRKRVTSDGVLSLTSEDVDRIRKYAKHYGKGGGFQGRLRPLTRTLSGPSQKLERFS